VSVFMQFPGVKDAEPQRMWNGAKCKSGYGFVDAGIHTR
jgi:hypothetical protein